ncbi:MAG: type II toxin-antitoxin system PemK/MazF family toxin [Candidatus Saccharimonadales bacterium]
MIRGAVYQIDLGRPRGHEQGGKRYGLVVSPSNSPLSVCTVIPTSTSARPGIHRPEVQIAGRPTRLLVDQIRTIDTDYVGETVDYLTHAQLAEVESALGHYLGLARTWSTDT